MHDKPAGRRLAIPDIHGCVQTFRVLLDRIQLSPSDQLFLLGDYINKGPNSGGVLEEIIKLVNKGYQVHKLRGNHEEMFLEAHRKGTLPDFVQQYGSQYMLNKRGQLPDHYLKLLKSLSYYIELEDYYLVHAGFNFSARNPLRDWDAMLHIRDYPADKNFLQGKKIVHGHNPKPLSIIRAHIDEQSPVIPLDNGCVYHGERPEQGNLLCFDLDTHALHIQENVEAG